MGTHPDLYTLAEAAELLGVTPTALRMAYMRGGLEATRMGKRLLVITGAELDRQLIRRGKPPRGSK